MTNIEAASVLQNMAESINRNENASLKIPVRCDGSEYRVEDLAPDQKQALADVLHAVWQYCNGDCAEKNNVFRMTVSGVAGSGKSTWINTVVTLLCKLFPEDEAVSVFAPTGCAAFNAGGQTLHRGFMLPRKLDTLSMSDVKTRYLLNRFAKTLIIIIDERSMLDACMLGITKHYMEQCAHGGRNKTTPWGGIPIIILVGDDYQLPPIMPGAFYAQNDTQVQSTKRLPDALLGIRAEGFAEFRELGTFTVYLEGEKRVNEGQDEFKRLLSLVRCEKPDDKMNHKEVQRLLELHLSHRTFSQSQRDEIEQEATYIFANKEPRDKLNSLKLRLANLKGNPVAIIKSKTTKQFKPVGNNNHFDVDRHPSRVLICKGARVTLNGCNPDPKHGLYHGALGIVHDIVYDLGNSPKRGDFPAYVLVEFFQFCGINPIPNMPRCIPVAPIKVPCNHYCCERTYMPLALAYGKTAHTFQGQNVGPVPFGRPANPIQKIIVDPGTRQFEASSVGLFYQLLSRATTIGTQADKTSSAIYFDGPNFCEERFLNLTMSNKNEPYKKVLFRQKWVDYLRKNQVSNNRWADTEMEEIFGWANNTTFTSNSLSDIIQNASKQY